MKHARRSMNFALSRIAMTVFLGVLGTVALQTGSGALAPQKIIRCGTIIVGSNPGASLDPISPLLSNTIVPLFNIYDGLFYPNGRDVVPDLATGYKYSDGNKVLTINLRKGVHFQDGTPFNA